MIERYADSCMRTTPYVRITLSTRLARCAILDVEITVRTPGELLAAIRADEQMPFLAGELQSREISQASTI
ncbi:hypothetical protein [Micromonospora lupini]|uniref:hypothetical protein n=1 Tax=Micromonospora lupini TaxID=285679 RepID=UPI0033C0CD10